MMGSMRGRRKSVVVTAAATGALLISTLAAVSHAADFKVWHPVTLDFEGPVCDESDSQPNPFLDFRLQVTFTGPNGQQYDVPGFFDGDGNGGGRGCVWRVRFSPDQEGVWRYRVSFRQGEGIAVCLDSQAGRAIGCDGQSGSMDVLPRDLTARGFLKWGRLQYVGGHYLKFQDGPYWIRGGSDSPEDFLAYAGFDNTPPSHHYAAHAEDWNDGDPDWGDGRGRAIIGAVNYLASKHVNSIYFLVMNVGGDGGNVWPWVHVAKRSGSADNDNFHYDVSKLRQWNTVFDHAQRGGIFLHFVFNEAEEPNKRELDDGELGAERKLYYREMIARYGHHLALEWNLCEEYNIGLNLGHDRIRAFADYIQAVDPYDHPITVHSAGDPIKALEFTFGDDRFSLTSIQLNQRQIDVLTEEFREATREAGRPLPVSMDEFTIDRGQEKNWLPVDDAQRWRKEKLWPTYLSGGNIEFILGDLLRTESFKTMERGKLWDFTWYARRFMQENLPFWEMEPADQLVIDAATLTVSQNRGRQQFEMGAQVLAKRGEIYAIYLPKTTATGRLDLSGFPEMFQVRWYDPRSGEFQGQTGSLRGGAPVPLGTPPHPDDQDWVVLVTKSG